MFPQPQQQPGGFNPYNTAPASQIASSIATSFKQAKPQTFGAQSPSVFGQPAPAPKINFGAVQQGNVGYTPTPSATGFQIAIPNKVSSKAVQSQTSATNIANARQQYEAGLQQPTPQPNAIGTHPLTGQPVTSTTITPPPGTANGTPMAPENPYAQYARQLASASQYSPEYIQALKATQDNRLQQMKLQTDFNNGRMTGDTQGFISGVANRESTELGIQGTQANLALQTQELIRQGNIAGATALLQAYTPQTLGAGSSMVSPDGQVISTAPSGPGSQPASVQEYQYAVSQGFQGSFSDYQTEDANRKARATGLTDAQKQTTINSIVSAFDNEQVVKNYNVIAEGYQFAQNLVSKEKPTASDDQGLIYAFAKAMDPNSVVREGEYATVQKYAQSWAETFGFNAKRIFSNNVFLTKEARQNMLSTIQSRYQASEQNYTNIANEYKRRIQAAGTGQVGGSITNYAGAYSQPTTGPITWDSL